MQITQLDIHPLSVPMAAPHRTASGVVAASPLVALRLHTDSGVVGEALVFTYTPLALKALALLLRELSALVVGPQVTEPAALWAALQARFRLLGPQGLVGMALAGIDMAVWDAHAKLAGKPLHRVLGHARRGINAYAPVGFDGELGSARAAEAWAKRGFRGVKAKIGYPSVEEDVAVIRAMRQAVGPDVALMVDYNQSLTREEAQARLQHLQHEGLIWVEEPIAAHDFLGLGELGRSCHVRLQAGENWWGPADFATALASRARQLWMPDVMKVGGVSGFLQVLQLASGPGVPMSSHLWPELSAQLLCGASHPHWLEWMDWWAPLLQTPLEPDAQGRVWPSEVVGNGDGLRLDALGKYAV